MSLENIFETASQFGLIKIYFQVGSQFDLLHFRINTLLDVHINTNKLINFLIQLRALA